MTRRASPSGVFFDFLGIESMRPLLARTFFFGFLVITFGIVQNALYFQGHYKAGVSRLAKSRSGRPAESLWTAKTTGSLKPGSKRAVVKRAVKVQKRARSSDIVGAIQSELKSRGYRPGRTDGIADIQTRAAIMAYEYDNGWEITGIPSKEFLRRLIFGSTAGKVGKGASLQYSPAAREIVMLVQKALAEHGYAPGHIDGLAGKETRRAIAAFERDRRLQEKGRISGRIIKEMSSVMNLGEAPAE